MSRNVFKLATVVVIVILTASLATSVTFANSGCDRTHIVQQGETLFRIARRYGTTVAELQRIHNLGTSTRIYAGQTLCVLMGQRGDGPNEGFTPYAVKRGDTLARIARRFGVEMTVLAKVNKLADANKIYAGQVLRIPAVTIQ